MFLQRERAFQWNRISSFLVLASVFSIAILTQGKASAQGNLVSASKFCCDREHVGGTSISDQLRLGSAFNEARSGGQLLEVWRGADNNNVWMSLNNGTPFTFGGAATFATPTVVSYGSDGFMVIFVGFDDHIWYAFVAGNGAHSSNWSVIPNQSTDQALSAVQMGGGELNVFVGYHGEGGDNRIFETWFDGLSGSWSKAEVIENGTSPEGPAVTYDPHINSIYVFAQGLDNELFMTQQTLGAHGWQPWKDLNRPCFSQPALAATPVGAIVAECINSDSTDTLYFLAENGNVIQQITDDGVEGNPFLVELTTVGSSVYALYDSIGDGWNRLVYQQ